MRELNISIEISGVQIPVGTISGNDISDAVFSYSQEYIEKGYPSISISLPTSAVTFSPDATRNFFEGLLPEGFARRSVAARIHASENDYLTILEALGSECLGAIRVSNIGGSFFGYKPLFIDDVKALAKEGVSKSTELVTEAHLSLTGASGKAGLYYDDTRDSWYMPMGNALSTHIVKQSHIRLNGIVANE